MSETRPRIALIHALAESVAPAHAAFAELWPEAWCGDLLDTMLSVDRAEPGSSDAAMVARCVRLADYAAETEGHRGRTDAILFTCSAFGPGIEAAAARHSIPVLKPNQAAFEQAITLGRDIGLIVTFARSAALLEGELAQLAVGGTPMRITTIVAEGAMAAARADDLKLHDALICGAAQRLGRRDAIVLGQFSMARASPLVRQAVDAPVITTPGAAVAALRALVAGRRG